MLQSESSLYLAGLFLRFGVPLGLTIFLAWLLRNLDLHWLEEVTGERRDEKIDLRQEPQGCWIIHNLPQEKSLSHDLQEACWKVRMGFEGVLPDQCLDCQYFKEGLLENAA